MEGNVQKMREALEIAKKAICHHARTKHTCDSLAWENSTINANCGDILCGHRDLCDAKTAIQKALSALPRNCDRFKTADEAWNAFDKWVESFRVNRRMPPYNVFGWLFATAETEGETDGK